MKKTSRTKATYNRFKTQIDQLLSFVAIGLFQLVLTLSIFYITLQVLDFPLIPTYVTVYIVFTFISYKLNASLTFRIKSNTKRMIKYYFVFGIGLIFSMFFLSFLENNVELEKFYFILINLFPRTVLTYTLTKFWVFKKE